ncbi:MAG: glycogen debranching protein [Mariniphaga sp.]|nr:glycogen debranching protein [Mariniphaga sp.]
MKTPLSIEPKTIVDCISHEWLETNGLGGWASSTICGLNTRRYHGLLVAAKNPPSGRFSLLSKLDETVIVGDSEYELGSNQYPGAVHPEGYQFLTRFEHDLFPTFYYQVGDISIKKTIAAIHDENTTVIIYDMLRSPKGAMIEFHPFISGRDYHSLNRRNGKDLCTDYAFFRGVFNSEPCSNDANFFISIPDSEYQNQPEWYYNFEYALEKYRGQEYLEDLFRPCILSRKVTEGESFGIIISTEDPKGRNALKIFNAEKRRRIKLTESVSSENGLLKTLTLAADQFIVSKGKNLKTIIAGYHWFTDWGRDTMIALPGLTLATGRFADAKKILRAFAENIDEGMIPNRFPDHGEFPEYNTIDASLWFFVAGKKYFDYTKDIDFVEKTLLPAYREIIKWHLKGTKFGIRSDNDGLLSSNDPNVQLTWMDAKVGDWVVTPRNGKAVEINALWYNSLMIFADLLTFTNQMDEAAKFYSKAEKTKKSFETLFWNEDKNCLFDVVNPDYKDGSVRPNQLFALSLPYPLFAGIKVEKILKTVKEQLLTPFGLRSLSPSDTAYKSHYGGSQLERDGAYHQGTTWSWLLGPYIDALVKVDAENGKEEARKIINNFSVHLSQAGIGTISEIFDGDSPFSARGCIAQAWSVAELLRVIKEHQLFEPGF